MVIVAIPWQLWLIYLPLLLTYRLALWTCVLFARLLAAGARIAVRTARARNA